jgi:thiopurine S-methyltransferase
LTDTEAAREIPSVERRFWQGGVFDTTTQGLPSPQVKPARRDRSGLCPATPALCDWLDGHPLGPGRALVPGCGRGHDVIELARRGFDTLGVDFAGSALRDARALAAREERALPATGGARTRGASIARAAARFLERDLFTLLADPDRQEPWEALPSLEEGSIDLWWENTCYCAIDPARRGQYASIAARLVRRGGTLLLLAFSLDGRPGKASAASEPSSPPHPIRAEEIAPRFAPHFVLRTLAPPPRPSNPHRVGRELLAVLERV